MTEILLTGTRLSFNLQRSKEVNETASDDSGLVYIFTDAGGGELPLFEDGLNNFKNSKVAQNVIELNYPGLLSAIPEAVKHTAVLKEIRGSRLT